MAEFGSNILKCPIPIVFEDRYFILEQEKNQDIFSVFVLHEGTPIFEILKNTPQENPLTVVSITSTGFITVGHKERGDFIYKIRPEYRGSSIFGRIKGQETEIKITDNALVIGTNNFQNNMVSGYMVGIVVTKEGSIGIGAQLPDEAKHLFMKD